MTTVLDVHEETMKKKSASHQHNSFWQNWDFNLRVLEANLILKTSFPFLKGFFQWGFIYASRQQNLANILIATASDARLCFTQVA